jgi:Tol biopolymer transport system component
MLDLDKMSMLEVTAEHASHSFTGGNACGIATSSLGLIMRSPNSQPALAAAEVVRILLLPCSLLAITSLLLLSLSCADDTFSPRDPTPILPHIDTEPAWGGNGQIAFYHHGVTWVDYEHGGGTVDPDSVGIWLMEEHGSDKQMILKNATLPDWSPDNQWLAVVVDSQVWKVRVNGDSLMQVTRESTNFYPSWSPDGQWIASSTVLCPGDSTTCGVRITSSDGSDSYWLTSPASEPDWNPNGESIIFAGVIDSRRSVVSYDLDRKTMTMIVDLSGRRGRIRPKYSPDGETIAFGRDYQIWLVNSDGTHLRQLTPHNNVGTFSWSPDGSQLVYARQDGLWIINADGTNAHQITFPPN